LKKSIAVDFDGTLHFGTQYPFIGDPNIKLINFIKEHRNDYIWILWTCRAGIQLKYAQRWLREQGVRFDYYNNNPPWVRQQYKIDSRKIVADYYIDDRNITLEQLYEMGEQE